MILTTNPSGPMNSDQALYLMPDGSVLERTNLRVGASDAEGHSEGYNVNIKGNEQIAYVLPAGTNKCIGSVVNERTSCVYLFIHNSGGLHSIYEFNYLTNVVTKVLQDKTDFGGTVVLNFQLDKRINHADVIDNKLLAWTDGANPPRSLNIDKAKSSGSVELGGYPLPMSEDNISLIKKAPIEPVLAEFSFSNAFLAVSQRSHIQNLLVQFKHQWQYEDGQTSAWSTTSDIAIPKYGLQNVAYLSISTGSNEVSKINLAVRFSLGGTSNWGDWSLVNSFDKNQLAITDDSYYQYVFKVNSGFQPLDQDEANRPYDDVPLTTEALAVTADNRIVLGNNTYNYNLPSLVNSTVEAVKTDMFEYQREGMSIIKIGETATTFTYRVLFTNIQESYVIELRSFSVTHLYNGIESLTDIRDALQALLGGFNPDSADFVSFDFTINKTNRLVSYTAGCTAMIPSSVTNYYIMSGFRPNSQYEVGIIYYDKNKRYSPVIPIGSFTTNELEYVNNNAGDTEYFKGWEVKVTIKDAPPAWATHYRLVRTQNLTTNYFVIPYLAKVTALTPTPKISIDKYLKDGNDYSFLDGDRIIVRAKITDTLNFKLTPVTIAENQITSFDATTNELLLENGSLFGLAVNDYVFAEIYRPLDYASNPSKIYYEFDEVFEIGNAGLSNRYHKGRDTDQDPLNLATSPAIIHSNRGEAVYTMAARYPTICLDAYSQVNNSSFIKMKRTKFVESGTSNLIDPTYKQVKKIASVSYSEPYVSGSLVNGTNKFTFEGFKDYQQTYGAIKKMAVRENYLVIYQQLRTGQVGMLRNYLQNLDQGSNVSVSDNVLSEITYYQYDDSGIGDAPSSFTRIGNTFYHVNPNIGMAFRLSAAGMEPISETYHMNTYFSNKLKSYIGVDKVIGYADTDKGEAIWTFEANGSATAETIGFSENLKGFSSLYSFIPDQGFSAGNELFTLKNGGLWKHEANDVRTNFYGVQYNSSVVIAWAKNPMLVKSFVSLFLQSNSEWSVPEITTELGQLSQLPKAAFYVEDLGGGTIITNKEGIRSASFMGATNSTGGLIDGDRLKGVWIKCKLSNDSVEPIYLFTTDVKAVVSSQGIR